MDNYEEKNVNDAVRKERCQAMEHMLSILYCRSVFRDFRKPVELMYPHLAQTYGTLVKRPMDLGTLLLKAKRREIVTIQEFRTTLQLVHNNALLFNEGAPLMEAISRHLEHFSEGLFEEIMRFPYHSPVLSKTKVTPAELVAAFPYIRLQKRRTRMINIRDHPLTTSEAHRLLRMLATSGAVLVPTFLQPVVAQVKQTLASRLSMNEPASTFAVQDGTAVLEITLRSVFRPLLRAAATFSSPQVSPAGAILLEAISDPSEAPRAVRSECLAYLGSLEEQLALLAVLIEERVLRGTAYSSIWAVPSSQFVYAQSISMTTTSEGKNRSPWWPCMIIAAGASASAATFTPAAAATEEDAALLSGRTSTAPAAAASYQMPPDILKANLARIPADIVKQLIKLRPRVVAPAVAATTVTETVTENGAAPVSVPVSAPVPAAEVQAGAHPLSPPEGYMLLEYFGAHDFGWVKCDSVHPVYEIHSAEDGFIEIAKYPAPGKQCNKDIVAEADEAWCVLLRQKRREGLCGKGVRAVRHITPAAPPISGAEDEIAFAAVDTSRDFSSSARDSAGLMAGLSQDALNSEGDDLDRDLPAPPGLAELEESVDVPYTPEIFDTAASSSSSVGNGEAHSSASSGGSGNGSSQVKATKSQGSSRSSRKSLSAAAADSYLDDSATGGNGQQGTFYVPGPRKGSFVPASTQNVVHFAPAKEDRRLYFATAEDILRFRADVEYVLPEDLTVEDLKSCVQEGKFHASMCPLPLPSLDSASTGRSPATEFKDDLIIVDPATRATFRPKALMRTKALGHFLGSVRPLHFDHYSPTPSKRTHAQASAQPAAHASAAAHKATTAASISSAGGAGGGEAGAGTDATAAEDGAKGKKTGADLVPTKPEKRKYVFKNRPAPAAPPATAPTPTNEESATAAMAETSAAPSVEPTSVTVATTTTTTTTTSANGSASATVSASASASTAAAQSSAPITSASIHVPTNLTLSASCFVLDTGCSRFAAGDGSVYTRSVDTKGKIFHLEAKSCTARKRILRAELAALQAAIDQLQQMSQQRQLRENERKIRFQELQQQQLQQLQHQQQYALQAQQQHQQYLMQLIDQQHQLQQQQLQNMAAPGARKPSSSKPKPAKAPPVPGAAASAKPKTSKPAVPAVGTVIYSADGTTSAPPTVSDAASATNGDSSTDLVVAPSQPTPPTAAAAAPKKKARTSEGEIKYDENGEPLKPPAKRAKAKHPPKYATAEAEALPQAIPCEGSLTNDSNGAGCNGLLLSNALDVLASAALNSPPSAPLPAPSLVSSCDTSNSNDHGSVKALKRKIMGMGEELSPAIDNDGMNMEVDDASAAYA